MFSIQFKYHYYYVSFFHICISVIGILFKTVGKRQISSSRKLLSIPNGACTIISFYIMFCIGGLPQVTNTLMALFRDTKTQFFVQLVHVYKREEKYISQVEQYFY